MNPKVIKLKAEREKNCAKIEKLTARNKKIDVDIVDIENTDIVDMVREQGLTPDMLMDLLLRMQKNPLPGVILPQKEEAALEE
ncbi:MAG: DUF4315 family protein [Oscillospiraceae bacterium]|nr:DUF4315 family protein [Oscillospiraceae bacterium]